MLKKAAALFLLCFFLIPCAGNGATQKDEFVPYFDTERQLRYQDFTEIYYIIYYHLQPMQEQVNPANLKEKIEVVYPDYIKDLEDFIKRRPNSEFVGEVKLTTAELYSLIGRPDKFDKLSPYKINYHKGWKDHANFWLIDIVVNHPEEKRFNFIRKEKTREYTAAIAMWYLGVWNYNPHFLARLVLEYPTSEYAPPAARILRKAGMADLILKAKKPKHEKDKKGGQR